MSHLSLRWRIVAGFMLASFIPSAFLRGGYFYWIETAIKNRVIGDLNHVADKKSEAMTALFIARLQGGRVLAQSPAVVAALPAFARAYRDDGPYSAAYAAQEQRYKAVFYNFLRETGFYDLLLVDNNGEVVFTLRRESDFATNLNAAANRGSVLAAVFRQAQATLTEQVSEFRPYGPSHDRAAFFVTAPVMAADGVRSGVLALQVDYPEIHGIIEDFTGLGRSGETAVAQKSAEEAMFIMPLRHRPDAAFKLRVPLQRLAMKFAFGVNPWVNFYADYRGVDVVAATRYIPLMRWGMVVKMDTAEAFAEAKRFHLWAAFFICFGLAIFAITGVLIARSIISPIRDLQLASQTIAAGMFKERIAVARDDEVGDLGRAFNSMADKLQSFYEELEKQVAERTKRLSGILETAAEAIISVDGLGSITHFNQGAERIFGYKASEVLGHPIEILLPIAYREQHRTHFEAFLSGPLETQLMSQRTEIYGLRKDGSEFPAEASISKFNLGNEVILNVMLVDITERKRSQQTIQFQATHDLLTGLPNRVLFLDRLEQAVESVKRQHNRCALLFIDLDGFKAINDAFGHQAGDFVLSTTAERLKKCVREADTVARLGGDEFTVILEAIYAPDAVAAVCEKILAAVAEPITSGSQQFNLSCSIGVALYPNASENRDMLIQHADDAMYEAKDAGKNLYRFFTHSFQEKVIRDHELAQGLKMALKENRIEVFYQPIVDLRSNRLVAAEALARWRNGEEGYIAPELFIPIAENHGLMSDIGCRVLEIACGDALNWQQVYSAPLRLSVNKSPRQFRRDPGCQAWFAILERLAFPLELLTIEITEGLMLSDDAQHLSSLLQKFRNNGMKVALDDFGTGYSSLNYLRNIPLDILKIDRSFVRHIDTNGNDRLLVETIVALAHAIGVAVVAEGIETQAQCDLITRLGCEFAQGNWFAEPRPAEQFLALLRSWDRERDLR